MIRRAIVLGLALLPSAAFAFVPEQSHWATADLPVGYRINLSSIPPELGQAAGQNAVEAGFATWAAPACSAWRSTDLGNTNISAGDTQDGENSILWLSGQWPAELGDVNSVIGVTTPVWGRSGFVDADIQFNNVGFTWSTTGSRNTVDAQSIAVHEEGHFLGLDHTNVQGAIMFPAYGGGLVRTLSTDDTNGVCSIYPTGVAQPDGGTGSDPCATNNSCGTCTPVNGCGWCATNNACESGSSGGPSAGSCAGQWKWQPSECSGSMGGTVPFGGACSASADCANSGVCISDGTNSFCSSRCTDGCSCPANYDCFQTQTAGLSVCAPGTNSCSVTPDAGSPPDQGFIFPDAFVPPVDSGSTQPVPDSGVDGGTVMGSDGGNNAGDSGENGSADVTSNHVNNSPSNSSRNRGGGCGCDVQDRSSPSVAVAWVGLVLALRYGRRWRS